jgi:hypothetical protein
MANITVAVDEELKDAMDEHPEINWSEVARQAFHEKLDDLEILEAIAQDSELTQKDIEEISDKIDQGLAERLIDE